MTKTQKNKIVKILTNATSLISNGWCKEFEARKNGKPTSCLNPRATHFCLIGAIDRSIVDLGNFPRYYLLRASLLENVTKILKRNYKSKHLVNFNDKSRNSKRVIDLLQKTIKFIANQK